MNLHGRSFSIISLVGLTLKSILQTKEFITTIQRAPHSIETLSDELAAITGLLRELGHLASGPDELDLNRIVREPLANCEKVAKQIEKLIQPYVKTAGGVTKWVRFTFGFKENDVLLLQRDIVACKQNLTLAVTSADLLSTRKVVRGMRRVQNHFGIASSSVAPSEIDERDQEKIQKWVAEIETIVEEEEVLAGHPEGTNQQTAPGRSSANLDDGRGSRSSRPPTPPRWPESISLPRITTTREESKERYSKPRRR